MSYYKLRVKCGDAEVEVIAKSGAVLAREVDKYLQTFLGHTPAPTPQRSYEQPRYIEEPVVQDVYVQPQTDTTYTQPVQHTPVVEQGELISLGDFIAGIKSSQIFEEFISSTYYLKKIAGQNSFTLKFLNSKFYPATNKLIDFAVIEEGKNRGFIDAIDDNGTTKYCLNAMGEEFFKSQLQ